jgi:hypothetical protein
LSRRVHYFDGVVHHRLGERPRCYVAQPPRGVFGKADLRGRRHDQRPLRADLPDLVGQPIKAADAEDHAVRGRVERE